VEIRRFAIAALVAAGLACREEAPPTAPDLPRAWSEAAIDATSGGRFVPERRAALRERQAQVQAAGEAVLHPHYAAPAAVLVGVKRAFVESGTRERLRTLLAHEAADPSLRVLALADDDPQAIQAALGLGPSGRRIEWLAAPLPGPSHVTFQFVRDYAPLVVSVPEGEGFRAAALAVYRGSTLNQIVDARLGVRRDRSPQTVEAKLALSRYLAGAYAERLGPLPVLELEVHLDGGNLLSDGRGTCFATRVLLAKNGGDRPRVERELSRVGCRRMVFLAAPEQLDFVQHVDTLLYVADPETLVLSMPTRAESDRIAEFQNLQILLEEGYTIQRVPRSQCVDHLYQRADHAPPRLRPAVHALPGRVGAPAGDRRADRRAAPRGPGRRGGPVAGPAGGRGVRRRRRGAGRRQPSRARCLRTPPAGPSRGSGGVGCHQREPRLVALLLPRAPGALIPRRARRRYARAQPARKRFAASTAP
jgi:hypothetical protein